MKKKITQICSLFVLAFILTASANAQTIRKYEADIPFDFQVGKKSYEAGDYIINLQSPNNLATILTIRNAEGRELYRTAVIRNGNTSKKGKTILVFNRYGNQYVLRQLVSPTFGFTTPKSKRAKQRAGKSSQKPEFVSLVLRKPKNIVE